MSTTTTTRHPPEGVSLGPPIAAHDTSLASDSAVANQSFTSSQLPDRKPIQDELHPSSIPQSQVDHANQRKEEDLAESQEKVAMDQGQALTGGVFYPGAIGNIHVTPATAVKPDAERDGGDDPVREKMVEKAVEADLARERDGEPLSNRTNAGPSLKQTSSSSDSSHSTVALSKSKPKKNLFGRVKKAKDENEKKAKQKEEEANALPPVGLFQLFRFSTPFELTLDIIGLLLAAAAGATQPLMTLIFGRLTTAFTNFAIIVAQISASGGNTPEAAAALQAAQDELKHTAGIDALYLMAIGIATFLATYSFMYIWNWTGEHNGKRIREKYLRAVLRQEIAYFDDLGAGEVATRIQTDCHLVQEGVSEKVAIIVQYLSTFITGFVLAYARSWRLALALSSILPVIVITGGTMTVLMTKYVTGSLGHIARAGTLAEEVIASIRTIHAFGTTRTLAGKFDDHIMDARTSGRKGTFIEAGGLASIFFSIYAAYALAFFYGGILVTQGLADAGVVINVFLSILIGSFSMAMLTPELQAITKAQGAAAKLFSTIDRVPLIDSASPDGLKPDLVEGRITFEGVKFHYPSRPGVPILKGLTTEFEAGHTCALVGASGSGKSTVVSLVERFYDPLEGVVKLDGRDIRTLNLKWLRQQIGLVSQEPTLFATTVRGNVEHGLIGSRWEHVSDAERFELVREACVKANADGFIQKLPNGYDTIVGERGMLLSGGQKQRVAIARAIVSDPRILLLDEATSALDTQSEGIVQDALDKASKGRTTITIAHRLSTIKDANKILVMGGGEILEQGTHNSLLENENGPKLVQATTVEPEDEKAQFAAAIPGRAETGPGSPLREKFPDLARAQTGRSLASALMDDLKAKREADEADDDHIKGMLGLGKRLLYLNREDKWNYTVGTIAAILSGLVYPALSILFGYALTDFQIQDFGELRFQLDRKALWYFIVAILAAIAIFLQISNFARAGWNLTSKLRSQAFHAVLRHDIEWFDEEKNSTGAVTSNIADQPQKVQGLMGVTIGSIIQSCATLVGGCIIGLIYGPLLALIGIACIPLLVSGGYIRLRVVVLKDERNRKIHAASAHLASEAAGAVRTVASLTREDDVDQIYSKSLEEPMRISNRTAIKSQALHAVSQGLSFLVIALVFYIGALWIISGRYTTNQFFTVLNSIVFAAIQAGNVFTFVPDASKARGAAQSIFKLLDDVPEIDALSTEGIKVDPSEVQGHIRMEGIHFRYPSRPAVRVLRDLTIDVPPGTYVALVGPSGCGKSTTIQMLERFYDPLAGKVTLDGVDIKDLNVSSYRNCVALVSQEPTLYAGSVRFNVLLGANKPMDQVPEEEIITACKNANIYDFIMSLPDGFDTEVGGKGSQLSGGQKQRIAIARALIRNPKVLLLDEATSALDSQSERVVQDALDRAAKGRTTIAIAHRLSTIQKADIIYCFSEGRVAEKGTHQELLAKRGAYFELVQMQNLSKQ